MLLIQKCLTLYTVSPSGEPYIETHLSFQRGKTMSDASRFFHTGKINKDELAELIASLGFTTDQQAVYADSYELIDRSLGNHFRLLSPIRNTESVTYTAKHGTSSQATHRVMAILWFDRYYHVGIVIEILGKDIHDHMTKKAHALVNHFAHEVPVATRTLNDPLWK